MPLPLPPQFEHLGNRPFSFYPPILNIEANEWLFRRATWSEVLVVNTRNEMELWIPRRFLGEVSRIEDPVVIVGLLKELEYKGGAVWPYQRRVIEMPVAVGDTRRASSEEPLDRAPVIGIRVESSTDSRLSRLVVITLVVGMVLCIFTVTIYREGVLRPRVVYTTKDQSYLQLSRQDDYYAVVRKLGEPQTDHWQSESGELQYRALGYRERSFTVILMGTDRKSAHYIGTMSAHWTPLHAVDLPRGGTTMSMLRELPKF